MRKTVCRIIQNQLLETLAYCWECTAKKTQQVDLREPVARCMSVPKEGRHVIRSVGISPVV